MMDAVIPSVMRDSIFVYIDDLLVVSRDFDTHIERLRVVAESLRRANLTINVEKSKFLMRSIRYLGHIVGNGEIKADPKRVQAITDFPAPSNVRQVRRFIEMTQWYHRYIGNFAAIAAPITDTLKKSDRFVWTDAAQTAFEALKLALTTAPVLTHPDFTREFFIQCDASITGVGGVLFQVDNDGEEHPIAFMSVKLNPAQRNYSVTEQECLAAILSVEKFRCYVEGMPFTIITDHASLKWLMGQRDLSGRLARWALKLQGYNFKIVHRKGSANIVPDALSRIEEIDVRVAAPISLEDDAFQSAEYVALREMIEEKKDELTDMRVQDGIIFRRAEFKNSDDAVDSALAWKIWVPTKLHEKVVADAHNPSAASHGGIGKTAELIRRFYYWPSITKDVRDFILRCNVCKETKAPSKTLRPPMGRPFPAERPFQRLYMDFLGPYPRSKSGNTTILIVLDQVSKFVWLRALKEAKAAKVVQYLETEIFHFVGAPESIMTDNGRQFTSVEFKKMLSRYGVHHIQTANHSPQVNASERVNRSIAPVCPAIRAYITDDQSNWDKELSAIACALRNSIHTSTGQSPFFAVFGQHMVQHAATYKLLRKLQTLPDGGVETVPQADHRHAILEGMRNRISKAQERNAREYNKRSRSIVFKPGQEVFIRNFQQSDFSKQFNAKLGRQWTPARIRAAKGQSTYEIDTRQGEALKVLYHAKDIKQ